MNINRYFLLAALSMIFILTGSSVDAKITDAQKKELIQTKTEEHIAEQRRVKPLTADEILEILEQRAQLDMKTQQRRLLLKTTGSVGLSYGVETNPANDSSKKGDEYIEEDFSYAWIPTFSKALSANVGYNLSKQDYLKQDTLSTIDHSIDIGLKYYPFESGKLLLEPGTEYEWLLYPLDDSSDTTQIKSFLKFTHYITPQWNYGGKYEYSHKIYYKTATRDTNQKNLDFPRADDRNTFELWVKRYINKYSVKLKGKFYRNSSNDEFQKYYDYDDYTASIALGGSFLKNDKLYLSFTPSFERKNYVRRVAVDTAQADKILNYRLDVYYTLSKSWTLNYGISYRHSTSNASTSIFNDMTNQIGLTFDF